MQVAGGARRERPRRAGAAGHHVRTRASSYTDFPHAQPWRAALWRHAQMNGGGAPRAIKPG